MSVYLSRVAPPFTLRSERQHACLGVAELVEVGPARKLQHRRRTAHEDVRLLRRRGQPLSAHGLVDEADLPRIRVRVRGEGYRVKGTTQRNALRNAQSDALG